MRSRRFLLLTTALGSTALPLLVIAACKKEATQEPPIGNPKGTIYDENHKGTALPLPANPKGSFYDAGTASTPPEISDPSAPKDAGASKPPPPPPSTTVIGPGPRIPPGNPKGSHYDAGRKP